MSRQKSDETEVIIINPTIETQKLKIRIAAYCRVSRDTADQLNSFTAQLEHYTKLIADNDTWELVDIYADEGISGLSIEKREDFKRLLRDCNKGKVDRILTKSISRFSRNTKECLQTIRELKKIGITVKFEKENIDTAQMKGEFFLTMLSGTAQQESMSISKNVRMGCTMRMKNGTFNIPTAPLGYELIDKSLQKKEEESEIVRMIFEKYLLD